MKEENNRYHKIQKTVNIANKLDNVEEMEKLLESYNLPKLNQEKIENLNRPIICKWIKTVFKHPLPPKKPKTPRPDGFTGEFYKYFKKYLIHILYKFFQKVDEKGMLPNSFSEAIIILILKPVKENTKRENYSPISLMNIDRNTFNKVLVNLTIYSKDHTP